MTEDVLATTMAGPAIRAWQIAEALAADHEVTLATTSPICERRSSRFAAESCPPARLEELERWCDVMIVQGYVLERVPALQRTDRVMVVDLYDPLHFEALELSRGQPEPQRSANVDHLMSVMVRQLARGDFFVCASEKQRDLWLGSLAALGRLNPATYAADPAMRGLIDVVPFGLSETPPEHTRQALKGAVPGIAAGDEVLLWGGGIYDWLDPLTLIRAVDQLRSRRPRVRLYFLGVRHPNPAVEDSRTLVAARRLAADLGVAGTHVFFNEGWVAYDDRQNYLLEADVAVSLHVEHLETAYSFRTRILDYLWAGLPIVATRGDDFAGLIEREGAGVTVPGGDVDAVERALFALLDDPAARTRWAAQSKRLAARYVWPRALGPLVGFCADPRRAADLPSWPSSACS